MAEQQPAQESRKSFFGTSFGLIILAGVLWILSGALAAVANVALEEVQFPTEMASIVVAYLIYAIPTLLALIGLIMGIIGAIRWAIYGRDASGMLARTEDRQLELLQSINQRLLLSETAKRIAYRHEDVDVLRQTIRQDIDKGDFDAALALVAEMGETYGYREEAEQYREQILQRRAKATENKVNESLARLDEMLDRREFDRAAKEAAKVQRLYGNESARVGNVSRRVVQAREQYKQDLERQFLNASERDDVDRAMELLKEMDKYLTEQEAEPFRETARGVIGKKRDNLGVQFKMAVHDRDWMVAVQKGEQIIREFPNSRMADEVRGMLDVLRERAAQQRHAAQDRQASPV